MHICPHCNKLGISTYAAIGDPFSRGLVSCRYCTNVSKRRRSLLYPITMPITFLLFGVFVYLLRPPMEFVFFWLCMFSFVGLILVDRFTEFDKYQPPGESEKLRSSVVPREQ